MKVKVSEPMGFTFLTKVEQRRASISFGRKIYGVFKLPTLSYVTVQGQKPTKEVQEQIEEASIIQVD